MTRRRTSRRAMHEKRRRGTVDRKHHAVKKARDYHVRGKHATARFVNRPRGW